MTPTEKKVTVSFSFRTLVNIVCFSILAVITLIALDWYTRLPLNEQRDLVISVKAVSITAVLFASHLATFAGGFYFKGKTMESDVSKQSVGLATTIVRSMPGLFRLWGSQHETVETTNHRPGLVQTANPNSFVNTSTPTAAIPAKSTNDNKEGFYLTMDNYQEYSND